MKKSGISRRRFIEYTGAAGLGIGLSSVLPQISLAKTGIKVASGAANPLGLAANTRLRVYFSVVDLGMLTLSMQQKFLQKSTLAVACLWRGYKE